MGVACEREGVEGEKNAEPGFNCCEGGPEAFEALELGGGVGEGRRWCVGEAMGVYCEGGGVNMKLEDC